MLSRNAKAAFYHVCGPLLTANGWVWHTSCSVCPGPKGVRLHLGPGQQNYLEGWVNIDANTFTGKCDIWADLRNPLPLPEGSVDAAYSHHVIEHLPDLRAHFADVFRVLKPGGVYRVGGPNGDSAAKKLVEGDASWFSDYPDKYQSVGGRFANFIFCRNEHLTILTASFLNELATDAGFEPSGTFAPTAETNHPDIFAECLDLEYESAPECPHTLLLEFRKPASDVQQAA